MSFEDLTGKKFHYLTVLSFIEVNQYGWTKWLCKCECGNTCTRLRASLIGKRKSSCGCMRTKFAGETRFRHGQSHHNRTLEYTTWASMIQRCTNPTNTNYHHYGGRGIQIHEAWLDFNNFYADMGPRPSKKHSLERVNVDGNYDPSNCKWATRTEQMRNLRSSNKFGYPGIEYDSKKKKYRAKITVNNKTVHIGRFESVEEAIQARKEAEIKYWGKSS